MSPHYVGNFRYGETPGYVFRYDRLEWLRWKINGKCVFVRENDELILEAFLDGASVVSLPRDRTAALKSFLPRLRYLLQGVPEKEDEVDMWTPGGKDRSHANGRDRSHADIDVKVEVGL